jgi:cystathionine beta-synthase
MAALPLPPPVAGVLDLIGRTPLVELTRFALGPCRLFVKLENENPAGSIKDRIALTMIGAAEAEGRLPPGGTLVEATAGNTGLGLALVAAAKGYRLILVIPDKMALEKINHLRALGAEVRITRSDVGKGHPAYYQDLAKRIAGEIPGAVFVNQFENPANPRAHEDSTGPEIFEQMGGDIDAVVVGVGSGGTLTGLGRYFRRVSPKIKMILADPEGSVLAPLIATGKMGQAGSWLVEGVGEDFVPTICDLGLVAEAFTIPDQEAFTIARELLRLEGHLGGSSTGTLLAAALRYARAQTTPKRIVTLVCDSGNKYLSKMYNDYWMRDQGFLAPERKGDLRDLVSRRHDEGGTVTVGPEDSLLTAYNRMRVSDVSQLPVLEGDKVVGLLDESDLLLGVLERGGKFSDPVSSAMITRIETVPVDAPIARLTELFARDHVALITEGTTFIGLITRIDLLNHLRRRMR